jgi:hypothetical protein
MAKMSDAHFDAVVAAHEHPTGNHPQTPAVMQAQHHALAEAGLLNPDEPTPWAHHLYQQRLRAEFTPDERAELRVRLGMV